MDVSESVHTALVARVEHYNDKLRNANTLIVAWVILVLVHLMLLCVGVYAPLLCVTLAIMVIMAAALCREQCDLSGENLINLPTASGFTAALRGQRVIDVDALRDKEGAMWRAIASDVGAGTAEQQLVEAARALLVLHALRETVPE